MWNRCVGSHSHSRPIISLHCLLSGLLSRVLAAQDPKLIVGVDISQGMVDQYNKVVFDHGISPEEMRAICVPLYEKLQGLAFDVIIVSGLNRVSPTVRLPYLAYSVQLHITTLTPSTK